MSDSVVRIGGGRKAKGVRLDEALTADLDRYATRIGDRFGYPVTRDFAAGVLVFNSSVVNVEAATADDLRGAIRGGLASAGIAA